MKNSKKSFYPESLNSDQLEILMHINAKEEKKENLIYAWIGFILFEICIIAPIFYLYYLA